LEDDEEEEVEVDEEEEEEEEDGLAVDALDAFVLISVVREGEGERRLTAGTIHYSDSLCTRSTTTRAADRRRWCAVR